MFTVYLIKVFGVGTLAFGLTLIKCCGVAINVAGLPNVRETLLRKNAENKHYIKAEHLLYIKAEIHFKQKTIEIL